MPPDAIDANGHVVNDYIDCAYIWFMDSNTGAPNYTIVDRGDCYELMNYTLNMPVEYLSREAAEVARMELEETDGTGWEVNATSSGTYVIVDYMDPWPYSTPVWTGSIFIRKDCAVYHGQYSSEYDSIQSFFNDLQKNARNRMFIIRPSDIDSEGYVTRITWLIAG